IPVSEVIFGVHGIHWQIGKGSERVITFSESFRGGTVIFSQPAFLVFHARSIAASRTNTRGVRRKTLLPAACVINRSMFHARIAAGFIEATGEDHLDFLHGLVSNDVKG